MRKFRIPAILDYIRTTLTINSRGSISLPAKLRKALGLKADDQLIGDHRISEAKFKELEKYAARPRDVLITVMATIGRVCVVPDDIEPSIITKHVYRVTVNRERAIPDYVGIALRGSREVRTQLMDSVQGQTRPGLRKR